MEKIIYNRQCPYCGDSFQTEKSQQKYDTDVCRVAFNNRKGYKRVKSKDYKLSIYKKALTAFISTITDGAGRTTDDKKLLADKYIKLFNETYDRIERGEK
jgi:hypothetical protein